MFCSKAAGTGHNATKFSFNTASAIRDKLTLAFGGTDDANYNFQISDRLFRDPSAWYHAVVAVNTELSSQRVKLWINGELEGTNDSIPQNKDLRLSESDKFHVIGEDPRDNTHFEGYMAEWISLDGTAVTDPDDFGELDDNGVWRPIQPSGLTFGTNGFYLKFDPTATNGLSEDYSGNDNHFSAPVNIVTSGTGTDVMSDTPTNNFCTLNPLYFTGSGIVQSEGNLKVTFPNAPPNGMRGGTLATTNAFYFEAEATAASSNQVFIGVQPPSWANNTTTYPGKGPDGWGYQASGSIVNNNSTVTTVSSWTAGDIIGVACHPSSGTIEFFKNGSSVYSGTSVADVPMTIGVAQVGGSGNSGTFVVNCGQRDFEHTAPTGFGTLSTSNIPEPEIKDGSEYFSTTLYTGVSGSQDVATGMATDLAWIKSRSTGQSHSWTDRVRGNDLVLQSNENSAETSGDIDLTSTGVTIGDNNALRGASGTTYVLWSWLAGGSVSADNNTNGSITSTVSVNATAGFSIVSYTGENAVRTVGHGLGVAPVMYMTKNRDSSNDWAMYWEVLGATRLIHFNLVSKNETDSAYWNDTAPTSTVFTVGTNTRTGGTTDDYIAYCFAEVEGFSKFSEYPGNGNTDGPFIYCGFRPAMVVIKNYAGGSEDNWVIKDVARDTYNPSTKRLFPNLSNSESDDSAVDIDFLSNGFKVRSTNPAVNESGSDFLYMAFAENPFGGDGVSPATAR